MLGQREPQTLIPMPTVPVVGRLRLVPCSLREANDLVARWHRHHAPTVGYRFAVAVADAAGNLHGAVIVGRPVARMTDHRTTCEVTRLVTDGSPQACSMLYGAAARAAKALGYRRIQTFTLASEPGTSLWAAGWEHDYVTAGDSWNRPARGGRREDQPMSAKLRWSKVLCVAGDGGEG